MTKAIIFDLDSSLAATDEVVEQLFAPAFASIRAANDGQRRGSKSLIENYTERCGRAKGRMARRAEGYCGARQRSASFGAFVWQGLGSPYPWWIFD
jgi:hypothetical protein